MTSGTEVTRKSRSSITLVPQLRLHVLGRMARHKYYEGHNKGYIAGQGLTTRDSLPRARGRAHGCRVEMRPAALGNGGCPFFVTTQPQNRGQAAAACKTANRGLSPVVL